MSAIFIVVWGEEEFGVLEVLDYAEMVAAEVAGAGEGD